MAVWDIFPLYSRFQNSSICSQSWIKFFLVLFITLKKIEIGLTGVYLRKYLAYFQIIRFLLFLLSKISLAVRSWLSFYKYWGSYFPRIFTVLSSHSPGGDFELKVLQLGCMNSKHSLHIDFKHVNISKIHWALRLLRTIFH